MKLLYIDCCISVNKVSRTKLLADTFLSIWKELHPNDEIEIVDVKNLELLPLNAQTVALREQASNEGRVDDPMFALAHQFAQADRIVIAAPLWEMSFPSKLRVYIEHVSAAGITFSYTAQGSVGKCRADKLLYLTTAGGPLEGCNYGGDHLKALCGMYGIPEYLFLGAPMQDVAEVDHKAIFINVLKQAVELAKTF